MNQQRASHRATNKASYCPYCERVLNASTRPHSTHTSRRNIRCRNTTAVIATARRIGYSLIWRWTTDLFVVACSALDLTVVDIATAYKTTCCLLHPDNLRGITYPLSSPICILLTGTAGHNGRAIEKGLDLFRTSGPIRMARCSQVVPGKCKIYEKRDGGYQFRHNWIVRLFWLRKGNYGW